MKLLYQKKMLCITFIIVALMIVGNITVFADEPVRLKLISWTYGVEKVRGNLDDFEKLNPNIKVDYEDISWYSYVQDMTLRFITKTAGDVIYVNDMWLSSWAEAGWVVPLEDYAPELIKEYYPLMKPYVAEGLTYKGKGYGMPYYNDTYVFLQNGGMLREIGYTDSPKTWDDVKEMSLALKKADIQKYPVIMEFHPDEASLTSVFYAMVYSFKPDSMFDDDLNPIFNKEGSAAYKALDWLNKALNEWKIMDPASLTMKEIDVYKSMQSGIGGFTIMEKYTLAEMNAPGSGKWAGQFDLVLMPGESHYTNGSAKFYALTADLVRRGPEVIDAAVKLVEYMGGKTDGKFGVAIKWAAENGLGFAYSELYDNPEVADKFNAWGNVSIEREQESKYSMSMEGMKTPWFTEFSEVIRREVHNVLGGNKSTMEGLNAMADEWNKMRSKYTR